jgi:hypothetical protein
MTHAGYVFAGYLVTFGAIGLFVVSMMRRIGRTGAAVPREDLPWHNEHRRPVRLSRLGEREES